VSQELYRTTLGLIVGVVCVPVQSTDKAQARLCSEKAISKHLFCDVPLEGPWSKASDIIETQSKRWDSSPGYNETLTSYTLSSVYNPRSARRADDCGYIPAQVESLAIQF
jgi:hypothetical protein